jgi:hypothetical protein
MKHLVTSSLEGSSSSIILPDKGMKTILEFSGDWTRLALANCASINFYDRYDFGRCSGQKTFFSSVQIVSCQGGLSAIDTFSTC